MGPQSTVNSIVASLKGPDSFSNLLSYNGECSYYCFFLMKRIFLEPFMSKPNLREDKWSLDTL